MSPNRPLPSSSSQPIAHPSPLSTSLASLRLLAPRLPARWPSSPPPSFIDLTFTHLSARGASVTWAHIAHAVALAPLDDEAEPARAKPESSPGDARDVHARPWIISREGAQSVLSVLEGLVQRAGEEPEGEVVRWVEGLVEVVERRVVEEEQRRGQARMSGLPFPSAPSKTHLLPSDAHNRSLARGSTAARQTTSAASLPSPRSASSSSAETVPKPRRDGSAALLPGALDGAPKAPGEGSEVGSCSTFSTAPSDGGASGSGWAPAPPPPPAPAAELDPLQDGRAPTSSKTEVQPPSGVARSPGEMCGPASAAATEDGDGDGVAAEDDVEGGGEPLPLPRANQLAQALADGRAGAPSPSLSGWERKPGARGGRAEDVQEEEDEEAGGRKKQEKKVDKGKARATSASPPPPGARPSATLSQLEALAGLCDGDSDAELEPDEGRRAGAHAATAANDLTGGVVRPFGAGSTSATSCKARSRPDKSPAAITNALQSPKPKSKPMPKLGKAHQGLLRRPPDAQVEPDAPPAATGAVSARPAKKLKRKPNRVQTPPDVDVDELATASEADDEPPAKKARAEVKGKEAAATAEEDEKKMKKKKPVVLRSKPTVPKAGAKGDKGTKTGGGRGRKRTAREYSSSSDGSDNDDYDDDKVSAPKASTSKAQPIKKRAKPSTAGKTAVAKPGKRAAAASSTDSGSDDEAGDDSSARRLRSRDKAPVATSSSSKRARAAPTPSRASSSSAAPAPKKVKREAAASDDTGKGKGKGKARAARAPVRPHKKEGQRSSARLSLSSGTNGSDEIVFGFGREFFAYFRGGKVWPVVIVSNPKVDRKLVAWAHVPGTKRPAKVQISVSNIATARTKLVRKAENVLLPAAHRREVDAALALLADDQRRADWSADALEAWDALRAELEEEGELEDSSEGASESASDSGSESE